MVFYTIKSTYVDFMVYKISLFWFLAQHTNTGRVLVVLDEISWIGSKDPDFLGKLKNIWDMQLSKNPDLTIVVCGSVSGWIEGNILSKLLVSTIYIQLILQGRS